MRDACGRLGAARLAELRCGDAELFRHAGNGDVGSVTVRVTATDGGGASVSDDFVLAIANTNDAPTVASPIADQAATEDSPFLYQLPADVFADIDAGDSLSYAATLADGSALPGWLSFDVTTRSFSGTPGNGDVGSVTVRVTATDGAGASVSDDFVLTVANTNDAPTSITFQSGGSVQENALGATVVGHARDHRPRRRPDVQLPAHRQPRRFASHSSATCSR
jgi:hypothetical protein